MPDPIAILLASLLLPAVLAGLVAWVAAWKIQDCRHRAAVTWAGITLAIVCAVWPQWSGLTQYPWALPAQFGICALILLAVAIPALYVRMAEWLPPVAMAACLWMSFPWASRGGSGYASFALILAAMFVFAGFGRLLQKERHWTGVWLWAVLFAAAPVICLSAAAIDHALAAMAVAAALGAAALLGPVKGNLFLARCLAWFPGALLSLLVGNAVVRYVPGPSEAEWKWWAIVIIAPMCLVLAPVLWVAMERLLKEQRGWLLGGILATLLAFTGAGIAMGAYLSESQATESSEPEWDYGAL